MRHIDDDYLKKWINIFFSIHISNFKIFREKRSIIEKINKRLKFFYIYQPYGCLKHTFKKYILRQLYLILMRKKKLSFQNDSIGSESKTKKDIEIRYYLKLKNLHKNIKY